MKQKRLSEDEAVQLILSILKSAGDPMTTRAIEEETKKLLVSCPDRIPVFLNRLRLKGLIEGRLSTEHRAWIWWVERKAKG